MNIERMMKVMAYFEKTCAADSTGGDRKRQSWEPVLDIIKCWICSGKSYKIKAITRSNCTI